MSPEAAKKQIVLRGARGPVLEITDSRLIPDIYRVYKLKFPISQIVNIGVGALTPAVNDNGIATPPPPEFNFTYTNAQGEERSDRLPVEWLKNALTFPGLFTPLKTDANKSIQYCLILPHNSQQKDTSVTVALVNHPDHSSKSVAGEIMKSASDIIYDAALARVRSLTDDSEKRSQYLKIIENYIQKFDADNAYFKSKRASDAGVNALRLQVACYLYDYDFNYHFNPSFVSRIQDKKITSDRLLRVAHDKSDKHSRVPVAFRPDTISIGPEQILAILMPNPLGKPRSKAEDLQSTKMITAIFKRMGLDNTNHPYLDTKPVDSTPARVTSSRRQKPKTPKKRDIPADSVSSLDLNLASKHSQIMSAKSKIHQADSGIIYPASEPASKKNETIMYAQQSTPSFFPDSPIGEVFLKESREGGLVSCLNVLRDYCLNYLPVKNKRTTKTTIGLINALTDIITGYELVDSFYQTYKGRVNAINLIHERRRIATEVSCTPTYDVGTMVYVRHLGDGQLYDRAVITGINTQSNSYEIVYYLDKPTQVVEEKVLVPFIETHADNLQNTATDHQQVTKPKDSYTYSQDFLDRLSETDLPVTRKTKRK